MINITKYLDIPYVQHGRGFDGCDCYGLVILYFKELGLDVIDYEQNVTSDKELTNSELIIENAHRYWSEVPFEQAQPHDCLLICNKSGIPDHCGIVVADRRFLHALEGKGCATSKLSTWRRRIHRVYRHKEMQ